MDEAGKEAPPRRQRLKQVLSYSAEFYRQLARSLSGMPVEGDDAIWQAVSAAHSAWRTDEMAAVACVDRCLAAMESVDAHANLPTLLECWLDDLALIGSTGRTARV